MVFVVNPDKKVTGKDDPGIAILNLYNFVKSDKEPAKALRFISDMSDDLEQREITSADVIQYFKKKYPDEDESLVFGADTDYGNY